MLKPLTTAQAEWVENTLNRMTTDEKIAQMVCLRYPVIQKLGGVEDFLRRHPLGAVYVGSEAIDTDNMDAAALHRESETMGHSSAVPALLVSDFEQGVGSQLDNTSFTVLPESMAIAATGNTEYAYQSGAITAREANAVRVHCTFGTVIDLNLNRDNPITGVRAYGDKVETVIAMGCAEIRGLQDHNCAATAKHFPGDGADTRNQHYVTSFNPLSMDAWRETYGKVWQAVIDEGVMAIMVGHLAMPEYEPMDPVKKKFRPATCSKKIMTDLLRGELGYRGLIVSDALCMAGFNTWGTYEECIRDTVNGGTDLLLWPEQPEQVFPLVRQMVDNGEIPLSRINDAVRHVLELKARLKLERREISPEALRENQRVAQQIAADSLTLLRNENQALPLSKNQKYLALLTPPHPAAFEHLKIFKAAFDQYAELEFDTIDHFEQYTGKYDQYEAVLLIGMGRVRFGDYRGMHGGIWPFMNDRSIRQRICISFANPFFLYDVPSVDAYVNCYSYYRETQLAAVRALFGEEQFRGKSPVSIVPYIP